MLETMLALKNNDMRKIPGYNPEPAERLRKLQRSLVGVWGCFISQNNQLGKLNLKDDLNV